MRLRRRNPATLDKIQQRYAHIIKTEQQNVYSDDPIERGRVFAELCDLAQAMHPDTDKVPAVFNRRAVMWGDFYPIWMKDETGLIYRAKQPIPLTPPRSSIRLLSMCRALAHFSKLAQNRYGLRTTRMARRQ